MDPCIEKFILSKADDLEKQFVIDLSSNSSDQVTRNAYVDYLKEQGREFCSRIIQGKKENEVYYTIYCLSGNHIIKCLGECDLSWNYECGDQIYGNDVDNIKDCMFSSVLIAFGSGSSNLDMKVQNLINKFPGMASGDITTISGFTTNFLGNLEYKDKIDIESFSRLFERE